MRALFRPEATRARNSRFLGAIRIARNPGFTLVTLVAVAFGAVLVAYALLGEITRKARLTGLLIPVAGALGISAAQSGTLLQIRVKEGDSAGTNQVLMVLGIDRSTALGEAAVLIAQSIEQRRTSLQAERALAGLQYGQRQQAVADRTRSLATEARQAEGELESARRRLELSRRNVERFAELARSGFVSEVQLQQRQEELLDLAGRESAAERNLTGIRRDALTQRAEHAANTNALQAQLAQLNRSLASLGQESTENSARRELIISAPQAGTVTALTAHPGQWVQPGQTLATIVPAAEHGHPSPLEAHLFAPSRTAGFVQPGQSVWVRYAAYPYQKFGMARGSIASVSRTPINPQDLPSGQGSALLNAAQSNEPMYRVTVTLDSQTIRTYGQPQLLKPGMTLEADVIQERRHVWEWMLEPVLAVSGLSRAMAAVPHEQASAR
jgi:membrane fusion protein